MFFSTPVLWYNGKNAKKRGGPRPAVTEKLYENAPYLQTFTATVLACAPAPGGYAVVLDRTAFYPEGGGQPCDTGRLGGAAVLAVHTDGDTITHTTDAPLPVGAAVEGAIDWPARLDAMQQHTGEHILSGTLHRLYGAENVGFHIGSPWVRMDTSIPLTAEQLAAAEAEANAAVRADTPVRCWLPAPEELARTEYRSKKALEGPVRLVEAGGDRCACCGTHLARTGEVGLIKIVSFQHYKGGMRLAVACGQRAYEAVAAGWADAEAAGRRLSVPVGRLEEAAERARNAESQLKQRLAALQNALAEALTAAATPGRPCITRIEGADDDGLRRMAAAIAAGTGSPCCLLAPGGQGLAYALAAAPGGDVRPACKALNEAFGGRGGGKPGFCQGSLTQNVDCNVVEKLLMQYSQNDFKCKTSDFQRRYL